MIFLLPLALALALALAASGCSQDDHGAPLPVAGAAASGGSAAVGPIFGGSGGSDGAGAGGSSGAGGASGAAAGAAAGGASGGAAAGAGAGGAGAGGTSGAGGSGGAGAGGSGGAGAGGASGSGGAGDGATRPDVVSFGPNVRVNDDTGNASQVEVAIAVGKDGVLLAGWVDGRSGTRCGYSVSRDRGLTWGDNLIVASNGNGITGDTVVGSDEEGNLYAVCQDYGTSRIRLATSTNSGDTWSSFADVQDAPDKPWIAGVRDGTLYLTWLGNPGGYKRSLDHGQTWGSVSSLGNIVHGTAIAPSTTGIVHIPHNQGSSLRYRRSTDWGETLEAGRTLSEMGSACFGCTPRHHPIVGAATDPTGQIVAITWASTMSGGDGDDDVWLLISQDGGDTWSERLRANDNTSPARAFQPWVAVDPHGRVHLLWTDFRNGGDNATYYTSITDPAEGFEPNIEVSDERGAPSSFLGDYKAIAIDGNDVIAIWSDNRNGDADIYFARAVNAAAAPAP